MTTLQSRVKGGRRQGRQRKRWEDNIREWKGLEFGKSQRAMENRTKWREKKKKLVAKSSVGEQGELKHCSSNHRHAAIKVTSML